MMLAGTKKCRPEHALGTLRYRGHLVDVERRRIRGEDRIRLRDAVELAKDVTFDVQVFEDRFDDESASASALQSSVKRIDWARFQASSCVSLPFCTWYMNMPITVWRALSTASSLLSTTTTGMPACANAIAIPLPIVPAPTTPAFAIGSGSARRKVRESSRARAPRRRGGAARATGSSARARRRAAPRARCRTRTAARLRPATASMSLCAAKPPFSSGGTILCACATTNGPACIGRSFAMIASRSEMRRLGPVASAIAARRRRRGRSRRRYRVRARARPRPTSL